MSATHDRHSEAAERVRAFLAERTRAHRDTNEIYSYGTSDGLVTLDHEDLEELVRSVLGNDVDLGTESPGKTRGRAAARRALGKALRGGDLLAAEGRSINRQADETETGSPW